MIKYDVERVLKLIEIFMYDDNISMDTLRNESLEDDELDHLRAICYVLYKLDINITLISIFVDRKDAIVLRHRRECLESFQKENNRNVTFLCKSLEKYILDNYNMANDKLKWHIERCSVPIAEDSEDVFLCDDVLELLTLAGYKPIELKSKTRHNSLFTATKRVIACYLYLKDKSVENRKRILDNLMREYSFINYSLRQLKKNISNKNSFEYKAAKKINVLDELTKMIKEL